MKQRYILLPTISLLGLALLVSCSKSALESTDTDTVSIGGARSAVISLSTLDDTVKSPIRPSAALGMYVSLYLAQASLMNVMSALQGVESQLLMVKADSSLEGGETFILLQEYGTILQVNLFDILNRSANRAETLNEYEEGLDTMNTQVEQKMQQLDVQLDSIKDERREQQRHVHEIEREIKDALREQSYTTVGTKQEELTEEKSTLTELESHESQTKRILDVFKDLYKIGVERLTAIEKNEEAFVAGIQVIQVPGIEDLGILLEE